MNFLRKMFGRIPVNSARGVCPWAELMGALEND
jgi:hypothetical protein